MNAEKIRDFDCELREIYEYELDTLSLGDTLIISENDFANSNSVNIKIHGVVYLGPDLSISKLGFEGRIVISTFDTLLTIYPYVYIYKLTFPST